MATVKLGTIHKSVHNAPQPTSQVGGSHVKPKTKKVISTIDRLKKSEKRKQEKSCEMCQDKAKNKQKRCW